MSPSSSSPRAVRSSSGPSVVPSQPPADTVLKQFRIIFNAVKSHFQQVERKSGIGGAQVWALSLVRDHPGASVRELASALNVKQPTASIIVRNLVQQGLLESRRSGQDKRSVQLHITSTGRGVLRRAPGPYTGVLPQALQSLPDETLEVLQSGLAQLIAALGTDGRGAQTPLSKTTASPADR